MEDLTDHTECQYCTEPATHGGLSVHINEAGEREILHTSVCQTHKAEGHSE